MMKKIIQLTTAIFLTSLLLGCDTYNKDEFKKSAQNMYDRVQTNLKIKGNFCYYLGSVKFPYTDEPVLEDDIQWDIWNKGRLIKTLPLFAEIGLLTREPVEGHPELYHYEVTELGEKYRYQNIDRSGSDPIYENSFCYGQIVVGDVTDVEKNEYTRAKGYSYNQTSFYVTYNYHVINVPDWVLNSENKLNAIYEPITVSLPEETYRDVVTFYVGKGDKLYQDGIRYKLINPVTNIN
ncbi:hypothetical protein H3S88_09185 [Gilliamella sp. B14448G11]|uniref:hypothetical protein n=1 Tax=unclassified Gilliamella TaxID=2685620 RepID=UPI0018DB5EF2|nr:MULTISPECIES: hypothetical protein [unclassified Gilliamella]MBI0029034.1 hypothetical protein [Gilliamella sp. B14448G7]MBI0035841.1 hypothetical protein [Gilliamella sp. B14448G11]MBI0043231.1 hypothetical protein [Gilliamella sp. B14448G12]